MNIVQLRKMITKIKLFFMGSDKVSFSKDEDGQEEDKNRIEYTVNG